MSEPIPALMPLLRRSETYLRDRGISNARREAEWIFAERLGLSRLDLYTRFDMLLDEQEIALLREAIQRRGRREPLAYILGSQPFCGLNIGVAAGVLVPRPETEELVAHLLTDIKPQDLRLLDVGTGSGAIALALKHAQPALAVTAVDQSLDALAQARLNGQRLGLEVEWLHGDLASASPGPWPLIAANLPYVGRDEHERCDPELNFEPAMALWSGADGLDLLRRFIPCLPQLLLPHGSCWLEHGDRQAAAIAELAGSAGLLCQGFQDSQGQDRFSRICHAN